jgi:hypothetical protein
MAVKKAVTLAGGGSTRNAYFLVESILRPCFLAAVERKPRIECFCQSVAFWISVRVAPLGCPISSYQFQNLSPLLSARGVPASLPWAGLAFLPALASFFGEALALLPLAAFLALRRALFWMASFFEEVISGATCAPVPQRWRRFR